MFERSPFEDFKPPVFFQEYNEYIYAAPRKFSSLLNKPIDQTIYLTASLIVITLCFVLKQIKGELYKKMFSVVIGTLIHFYVFGVAAYATVF